MAYMCINGSGECTGCGGCNQSAKVVGVCWCGSQIRADEDYYEIDGELIHDDCLHEWAQQYRAG